LARVFIRKAIKPEPQKMLTVRECFELFCEFYKASWIAPVERRFFTPLVEDLVREHFSLNLRNDVLGANQRMQRGGKVCRFIWPMPWLLSGTEEGLDRPGVKLARSSNCTVLPRRFSYPDHLGMGCPFLTPMGICGRECYRCAGRIKPAKLKPFNSWRACSNPAGKNANKRSSPPGGISHSK
jgi:hypothetical protein